MGIAAFQISTNRLIEWQSSARPGTCKANAIAAGFDPNDVEERVVAAPPLDPPPPKPPPTPDNIPLPQLVALLRARGIIP